MKIKSAFPLLLLVFSTIVIPVLPATAQVKLEKDFIETLHRARLSYFGPLEDSFKRIRVRKNNIMDCDMAIRSRKKELEIRYAIRFPGASDYPHINSLGIATSVASNQEETLVAVHKMDPEELKNYYNADWGATFYFRPKSGFSSKKHCKMLALYAEKKASVYIFYLFDQVTEELERQLYSFRFE